MWFVIQMYNMRARKEKKKIKEKVFLVQTSPQVSLSKASGSRSQGAGCRLVVFS